MSKAEDKLNLLAKILSQETKENKELDVIFDELCTILNKKVLMSLENSTYPNISKIFFDIERCLENIEPMIHFKEIIGKTLIGVFGSDVGTYRNLFDKLVNSDNTGAYTHNSNIPAIIHDELDLKNIKILNLLENQITLNKEDYLLTTRELYKDKIDIRQFIKVFSFCEELYLENSVIIHLPDYSLRYEDYFRILKDYSDVMFLFADEKSNWKYNLTYLCQSNYKKEICIFAENTYIYTVQEVLKAYDYRKLKISIYDIEKDFENVKTKYDKLRNNIIIKDYILSILGDIDVYYTNFIKKQKRTLSNINKDLLNIEDENTGESIRSIRQDLITTLDNEERAYKDFHKETVKLLEKANELEGNLSKDVHGKNIEYSIGLEEIWIKIVLQMIEIDDFKGAKSYIHRLEKIKFKYTFILEIFLLNKMNVKIEYEYIYKLNNTSDDHFLVIKGKIAFRDRVGLSDEDVGELSIKLNKKYMDKSYEYFVAARYYEKININKSVQLYYDALNSGSIEAGERLLELSKDHIEIDLEFLAQNMVSTANYELGIRALDNNKYARGITNLKIAAALGNIDAIKLIADTEYNKIIRNFRYKDSSKCYDKECQRLLQLYLYLYSNDNKNVYFIEQIGGIYFALEDYRKALDALQKCNTANSLFTCGRIYQYGKGTIPQDIAKAKEYFNSASKLGHKKAMVEYEKVCGWIEANQAKQAYRSSNNYSTTSTYSYESSSGGLCFITTATCVALDKEDDCEELIAFKHYRDTRLINDEDGTKLIREYYRIAPSIIEAIEETENPVDTYQRLWDEYIAVGYKYLLNYDYKNAKETYINMVIDLCERYEISIVM